MASNSNSSFYNQYQKFPLKVKMFQLYIKFLAYVRPSKAINLLLRIFLRPRVNRTNTREKYKSAGILEAAKESYEEINGNTIFTLSTDNPKVILVHGWESSALRFQTVMEKLNENNIGFLYFDLPGHGLSSGSTNNAVKTSKIIKHFLSNNPTIDTIIGHSFGGSASYLVADREISPDTFVSNIITVGSPNQYSSVFDPFFNFLKVPHRIRSRIIDASSEHVGLDFTRFNLPTMDIHPEINLHIFHDQSDTVVSVEDALRLGDKFNVHISEGLGHRKIMHDEETLNTIFSIFSEEILVEN